MRMVLRYLQNRFLGEFNYFHRKSVLSNKPEVFAIEITNYCNLKCKMCPRIFMKRKVGFMDFELFKKIVDQIKGRVDYISLVSFGEPLFHPRFDDFIKYCSENGIKTHMSTNATILNEKNALRILNSGLDKIYFSLDATTEETYRKLRVSGNFEETKKNIINFLKLKKKLQKKKPYSVVQMVKMKETDKEIDAFKEEWEDLADEVYPINFISWANQIDEISEMAEDRHRHSPHKRKRYPCNLLWRSFSVLWNGDVVLCCLDFDGKSVLGNLKKDKIDDLWNSKRMVEIRKQQINGIYINPLCKRCMDWCGDEKDIFYPVSIEFGKKFKKIMKTGL